MYWKITTVRPTDHGRGGYGPEVALRSLGERSAPRVDFSGQAVGLVIRAFNQRGQQAPERGSSRNHTSYYCFDTAAAAALRDLLHQTPQEFGCPTSVGTLDLAAGETHRQGLTSWRVSGETIRAPLARMEVRGKRAKHRITSPDPEYARKKAQRDPLIRLAQHEPARL